MQTGENSITAARVSSAFVCS